MRQIPQSTAYNFLVLMVDSTDHITGLPGLTLTITASKDGGAFAAITPAQTDLGGGVYSLAGTTAHSDTKGDLWVRCTATGADTSDSISQVVDVEVFAGKLYTITGTPTTTTFDSPDFSGDINIGSSPVKRFIAFPPVAENADQGVCNVEGSMAEILSWDGTTMILVSALPVAPSTTSKFVLY